MIWRKTLFVLVLSQACILATAAAELTSEHHPERTLQVNGSAEMAVPPDRATIRLGIQADAKTASEAQNKASQVMSRIVGALEKAGIQRAKMRTSLLRLEPTYPDPKFSRGPESSNEPNGFRASNTLQVTLQDLTLVANVLDTALEAGANRIDTVSFDLIDDVEVRERALRRAIKNAQQKARAMSDELGMKLGAVETAQEGGGGIQPLMMSFAGTAFRAAAAPVQPGEITVSASVTLTYKLVP